MKIYASEVAPATGSTLFAFAVIPDTWVSLGGRMLLAVVTTLIATLTAKVVGYYWNKFMKLS